MSIAFPITMLNTGFVGNALAILLVSRSYRLRESKRKKSFLLCTCWLALKALVGQLLTSTVVIVVYLSKQPWEPLDPAGRLCTFCGLTMTVFGFSSLFIASAMAIERALAIRAPHWYAATGRCTPPARCCSACRCGARFRPVAGVGRGPVQHPVAWDVVLH